MRGSKGQRNTDTAWKERQKERERVKSRRVSKDQQESNKRLHFCCILIRALPSFESNARGARRITTAPQQGSSREKGLSCSHQIYPHSLHSARLKRLDADRGLSDISSCNKVTSPPIKKLISCSMVQSRCAMRADVNLKCGSA